MKYIISMITLLWASVSSLSAQSKNTTVEAEKAFAKRFPTAVANKWVKENKHEYEVEFTLNDKKGSANFSGSGEWLETELEIPINSLPEIVKNGFTSNFPQASITHVYSIERKGNPDYFEIEYKVKNKTAEVKIDSNGKPIK
jgi:hypothetical protein